MHLECSFVYTEKNDANADATNNSADICSVSKHRHRQEYCWMIFRQARYCLLTNWLPVLKKSRPPFEVDLQLHCFPLGKKNELVSGITTTGTTGLMWCAMICHLTAVMLDKISGIIYNKRDIAIAKDTAAFICGNQCHTSREKQWCHSFLVESSFNSKFNVD